MINYNLKTDKYSSHQQIASFINQLPPSYSSILDLGCDTGFLGKLLQRNTHTLEGADINQLKLRQVPAVYKKKYCFDLNSKTWPINKKYDVVVLADTIEHLHKPKEAVEKILKILSPKGYLIISIPNSVHWWARLMILSGNFPKESRGIFDKTHLHFYTKNTFTKFLEIIAEIKIVHIRKTTIPLQFILGKYSQVFPFNGIYTGSYFLSNYWPTLFAYQYVYICRKNDQ